MGRKFNFNTTGWGALGPGKTGWMVDELGDMAQVRQGAKTQEYLDIPSFRSARAGYIGV